MFPTKSIQSPTEIRWAVWGFLPDLCRKLNDLRLSCIWVTVLLLGKGTVMNSVELRLAYIRTISSVIGAVAALASLIISALSLWIILL